MTSPPLDPRVESLLRDLAPQVLGAVVRRFRNFAASEDAVQEALIAAAEQWPRDGLPDNPRGWLIQVALRRMTDFVRSEVARRNRETAAADELPIVLSPSVYGEPPIDPDDTLVLLFLCCHPALTSASAVALTLRAGLELLAPLQDDERLRENHRLDAVRAHLLERAGQRAAAVELYRAAAAKTTSLPDRNYLLMKAARVREAPVAHQCRSPSGS